MNRLQEIQDKPDTKALRTKPRGDQKPDISMRGSRAGAHVSYSREEQDEEEEEYEDRLSPDDSILILTGANASGKSVYLKTVALIIFMVSHQSCSVVQASGCFVTYARNYHLISPLLLPLQAHIGSFVPASAAIIGLTDKIMTRVSTRESMSKVKLVC